MSIQHGLLPHRGLITAMWPLKSFLPDDKSRKSTHDEIPLSPLRHSGKARPSYALPTPISLLSTPRASPADYLQVRRQDTPPPQQHVRASRSQVAAMDLSTDDLLLTLARRSEHVTQQLQALLDAQSDGLLKGLGRAPADTASTRTVPPAQRSNDRSQPVSPDARESIYRDDPFHSPSLSPVRSRLSSSMAASTHTRAESRRKKVIPVRQPTAPRPPSLREARVGIAENLRALAAIKLEEARVYSGRVQTGESGLTRIAAFAKRRDGLTRDLERLEDKSKNNEEDEELERQELELDGEIRALEERLSELRAQRRAIRREREEKENNRAAELSSYKNALAELTRTVSREVLGNRSEFRRAGSLVGKIKATGVWGLPEDRRTLELVKEDIELQMHEAEESQASALREGTVCDEGAELWDTVVSRMVELEKHLGREVRKLSGSRPESRLSDTTTTNGHSAVATPGTDGGPSHHGYADGMQGVLERMDDTIDSLTSDLAKAEEQQWSLLVCCIGAEVEALKEAQELLGGTLVQSQVLPSGSQSQTAAEKGPTGPRSEGSGLTASMYTAKGSAQHTPVVGSHEQNGQAEDDHDERDVEDPQALFGAHEEGHDGDDYEHEHELQGPELLIAHD